MAKINISATIDESLRNRLNLVREKQNRSFSNAVESALIFWVSEMESQIHQSEEQSTKEK